MTAFRNPIQATHAPRVTTMTTTVVLASLLAVSVSGCGGTTTGSQALPKAGLSCVDDSNHCISQREKVFDAYMADKSRSWVRQPASANAYASGVRLFAMSKRRRELSCEELQHGKREADGAPSILRGPSGSKLTPAQISRGVMLASEVSTVLAREYKRRCRKA